MEGLKGNPRAGGSEEGWDWRGGQWPGFLKLGFTDTTLPPAQLSPPSILHCRIDLKQTIRAHILAPLAGPVGLGFAVGPAAAWTFPLA